MQYALFIVRSSLEDFRRNKMRTFLTSLGILIGVSSVVLLLAMGLGLRRYIQEQFESIGSHTIFVMPGSFSPGSGPPGGLSAIRFDDRDIRSLKKIRNITYTVPMFVKMTNVKGEKNTKTYEIIASTTDIFKVMNIEVEEGRLYEKSDADKGAKKAVLGWKSANTLFGSADDAIGKSIIISEQGYKVVGVAKAKGGGGVGIPSIDERVYIPFRSSYSFNPDKNYYALYLKADSAETIAQIKSDTKDVLLKRYKEDDFSVVEQTEILNTINSIFTILNSILVAIAAISLIVGGIGIMNIMFVSVVERIAEIGIRRAIGARRIDILLLFLTESVLLSSFGGILALLLSFTVVFFLQSIFPAYIDLATVIIALGVSSLVGVVFGVIPAKNAAALSPIEAIRYE